MNEQVGSKGTVSSREPLMERLAFGMMKQAFARQLDVLSETFDENSATGGTQIIFQGDTKALPGTSVNQVSMMRRVFQSLDGPIPEVQEIVYLKIDFLGTDGSSEFSFERVTDSASDRNGKYQFLDLSDSYNLSPLARNNLVSQGLTALRRLNFERKEEERHLEKRKKTIQDQLKSVSREMFEELGDHEGKVERDFEDFKLSAVRARDQELPLDFVEFYAHHNDHVFSFYANGGKLNLFNISGVNGQALKSRAEALSALYNLINSVEANLGSNMTVEGK